MFVFEQKALFLVAFVNAYILFVNGYSPLRLHYTVCVVTVERVEQVTVLFNERYLGEHPCCNGETVMQHFVGVVKGVCLFCGNAYLAY